MTRTILYCSTVIAVALITAITVVIVVVYDTEDTSGSTTAGPELTGPVTVGSATDLPGIMVLEVGSNKTTGFDADAARWLGAHSDPRWEPQFSPVPVDARMDVLKNKEVPVVIQAFSMNDDRLEDIDMAGPYLVNYQGVLVRKGDTARYATPDSLKNANACAPLESTPLIELQKRGANVTGTESVKHCVDLLRSGQVAVASTDQLILYGYAQRYPDVEVVRDNRFGLREDYGVGLPYGSYEQCVELTETIKAFLASPDWDAYLRNKFGQFDTAPYKPARLNECIKRQPPG